METNTTFQKKRATILAYAALAILGFATASMAHSTDFTIIIKGE